VAVSASLEAYPVTTEDPDGSLYLLLAVLASEYDRLLDFLSA
jgi:hypothetical protein